MSRLRRIAGADRIFFVTTNLHPRTPVLQPAEMDFVLRILDDVRHALNFQLLGYVVMPDHAHLLLLTRVNTLPHIVHQSKFKAGYALQQKRGRSGPFWQSRYFDFICRRTHDVSLKLEYIHQNPVAGNLAGQPENWKWSSAASYKQKGLSPLEPDAMDLCGDPNELLWLPPHLYLTTEKPQAWKA